MDIALRAPVNLVSTRAPLYWLLSAIPGWLLLLAGEAGLALLTDTVTIQMALVAAACTVVVAAVHLAVMPRWRYRVHRWEVTDEVAYTQFGWLTQERRLAPLSRVQTVDTRRGAFAQALGLADITITTASARGAITIQALDQEVAERTVAWLTDRAQLTTTDGT
jgi:uncharacterized protein